MTTRTRLADLMAQASPYLPLALSAALQAEHMAVCQEVDELRELLREARAAMEYMRMADILRNGIKMDLANRIDAALERKP
jgi:hypothetical protein